jgi:outer membrane protein assembly factor BamA
MPILLGITLLLHSVVGSEDRGKQENLYRIGRIIISRNQVFDTNDSTTNSWIARVVNDVHMLTKERTIRSRLLFQEGDVYDQRLIDETARLLRSMAILGDVEIRCDTVANKTVNIEVVTYDKWTIGLNASYKRDGGITSYSATIKDDNFLGNAQSISIGYNYSSDLRRPHGAEIILNEPHLFEDWWTLTIQYKTNEYLDIKTALLERDFFSDATSWSFGAYADAGRNSVRIFTDGVLSEAYDIHQENQLVRGALSFGTWPKLRLGFAYIRTRTVTNAAMLRPSDNVDLLNLSLGVMNRTYYTTSYVENFGRVEDVPLGYQASVTIGTNFCHFDVVSPDYFLRANWQHALRPYTDWYIGYDAALSSFLANEKFTDAVFRFGCIQHFRLSERNVLVLRSRLVLGLNWSHGEQLTLGSPSGLRGYPAYAFSGNRQLLVNLEYRFFPDIQCWIFRLGSAVFFDAGTVWNERVQRRLQRLHSSAGFGLRIENTKASGSGIIRIDVAFNLDEKRFAQLIFSSNHLFRAFQNIDYIPASMVR